jgi:hypothetical protein
VDDVNFGLQYPEATFDMVTSRFIAGGISHYFATIREMYRVLTGSGNSWIQITELRPGLYCDDNTIPADAASVKWANIFFASGSIGNTLGTAYFDEIATTLKARVQAAGFVDVREYIDKAPVGNWHAGNWSCKDESRNLDARMNRIGRCMAQGWLGFLEAMRPVMEPIYGSTAAVDNIIAQVRNDFANPNYHGYNLMYQTANIIRLTEVIALPEGSPHLRRVHFSFRALLISVSRGRIIAISG